MNKIAVYKKISIFERFELVGDTKFGTEKEADSLRGAMKDLLARGHWSVIPQRLGQLHGKPPRVISVSRISSRSPGSCESTGTFKEN